MSRNPWSDCLFLAILVALSGCGRGGPGSDAKKASAEPAPMPISNMVPVKAGSFVRIRHPVTITRDYWIGTHEVSQAEYLDLMRRNPSYFTGDLRRPVEKLSWTEAMAYCAELTRRERAAGRLPERFEYRLPTEAEWEFACRAGTTNFYSFGDSAGEAEKFAWTSENADGQSHPVGQKQPNPWGLYDMHGNVWEWCSDWFAPYPAQPLVDPTGPTNSAFKVFRGGGWNQAIEYARTRNRFMMSPTNGIHFVGFRVVLGRPLVD